MKCKISIYFVVEIFQSDSQYSFCHCQQQPSNCFSCLKSCPTMASVILLIPSHGIKGSSLSGSCCHFQPQLPRVSNPGTLWPINPEVLGVFPTHPAVTCPFADACLSVWNPSPSPVGHLASADSILKPQLKYFSFWDLQSTCGCSVYE